ncbi:MAG: hypothetical protein J6U52_04390 [Alistipes sp.]|nr:hypothetical protein [Alistipes sp.]
MIRVLSYSYPVGVIDEILTNHLRVFDNDQELRDDAIRCIKNAIDVASDYTNRVLCASSVVMDFEAEVGAIIQLPTAPVREVSHLYINGEEVGVDELESTNQSAFIKLSATPSGSTMAVRVEAECGYGEYLPGAIYQAVSIIASSFFEKGAEAEMPSAAKSLLNPYRIYPYEL